MKKPHPFSLKARLHSFRPAWRGIEIASWKEPNFRIHLGAAATVTVVGIITRLPAMEFAILIVCMGGVMAAELINSALEHLCDIVEPDDHPAIRNIKDMSAGAVLIMAMASAIIGLIILLPRILSYVTENY
jgi:diacylglycerol kinase (ATP)